MVLPIESPVSVYEGFLPLTRHLEKNLNRKIRLVVARNAEAAIEGIRQHKADIVYVCSVFYVIAHDKYGYMPVAHSLEDG
ncbi:MAG: PhnD/SsuA/transferrin family substrate-binding protein, partial [Nitrospirota bacterium]